MLNKKYRINNKEEYNYIYKNGKKIQARHMIVFVASNGLAYNRFGIVSSKKVGNAVVRNRARRQIRAIIQKNWADIKSGNDFVIVARYNMKDAVFALLEKDFLMAMKKARLD